MENGAVLENLTSRGSKEKEVARLAEQKVLDLEKSDLHMHTMDSVKDLPKVLMEGVRRMGNTSVSVYPISHKSWLGDVVILLKRQEDVKPAGKPEELIVERDISADQIVGLGLFYHDFGTSYIKQDLPEVVGYAMRVWRRDPSKALPIYDLRTKGLLYPRRMGHKEIVEALRRKNEVQQAS